MLRWRLAGAVPALVVGLTWSASASAHGGPNIGAFYAGALDLVLHWNHALFMLAAGAWCAQQTHPNQLWLGGSLIGGLMAGAVTVWLGAPAPQPVLASAAAYTLTGLAVAAFVQTHQRWHLVIAVAAGLASGMGFAAAAMPVVDQPLLFLLGMFLGAMLLVFYLYTAIARLPAGWPQIALRAAGSWIAAIGAMVCAFSLWQPV